VSKEKSKEVSKEENEESSSAPLSLPQFATFCCCWLLAICVSFRHAGVASVLVSDSCPW